MPSSSSRSRASGSSESTTFASGAPNIPPRPGPRSGVRGAADVWVAELVITYDGGAPHFGVSILEFRDDRVVRETIYVSEAWEAPEWRARWRDDG